MSIPTRRNGTQIEASWFNSIRDEIAALSTPTKTVTASYSLLGSDSVLFVNSTSGAVVITLPSALDAKDKRFTIKANCGASMVLPNSITVDSTSGTIDGAASFSFEENLQTFAVVSDGSNWVAI